MLAALGMLVAFACTEHGSRGPDGGQIGDAAAACTPTGSCANGPQCGSACCGSGERCDATGVCVCGGQKACTMGDICATGGPSGGDGCGVVCCGASQPCPL